MVSPERIIAVVGRVAETARPERVVLFGSYAYGTPTPDSDVDLLVVIPYRGPSHQQAARIRSAVEAGFPMDLLVRSRDEIVKRIAWNDFFLKEITERGVVLYAADNARVGAEGRRRLRRRLAPPAVAKTQPV